MRKGTIEFIGLPGAGKTTLLDYLVEQEKLNELGCMEYKTFIKSYKKENPVFDSIAYKLLIVTANFPLLISLLLFRLRFGKMDTYTLKSIVGFIINQAIMNKVSAPLIQEQGLIQNLASLTIPNTKNGSNYQLPNTITRSIREVLAGIVYIDLNSELSISRVNSRPEKNKGSRADALEGQNQVKFIEDFERALKGIYESYNEKTNTKTLTLEGTSTLTEKTDALHHWLLSR